MIIARAPHMGSSTSSVASARDVTTRYSRMESRSASSAAVDSDSAASRTSSNRTISLIRVLLQLKDRCVKYNEYAPHIQCTVERGTDVWWFPNDFCQARLGDRQTGSNACTLIAVIIAHRIEGHEIANFVDTDLSLCRRLVSALAESIVDGNEIHERLASDGVLFDVDLTLPEALTACGRCSTSFNCRTTNKRLTEWKTVLQEQKMCGSLLFEDLHRGIVEWETKFRAPTPNCNLYVVIIGDGRSILCAYQRNVQKVTLFDTHCHLERGAVVAQVSTGHLSQLCEWFVDTCHEVYGRRPSSYEVSFLYFKTEVAELCIVNN